MVTSHKKKIRIDKLYEEDFVLWLEEQTRALENRDFDGLDFMNLADEVGELARREKREVESRLEVLISHLAKLSVSQNDEPKAGWKSTIREQRNQLDKIFRDSPSLRRHAEIKYSTILSKSIDIAFYSLLDYEPENKQFFESALNATWDQEYALLEHVLETEKYFEVTNRNKHLR